MTDEAKTPETPQEDDKSLEQTARTLLKNVIDPELGLNIVDLGLIYDLEIHAGRCWIRMTFTTQGCPIGGSLVDAVYEVLGPMNLKDVKVETTFDPPWNPMMMTPDGKRQLGVR